MIERQPSPHNTEKTKKITMEEFAKIEQKLSNPPQAILDILTKKDKHANKVGGIPDLYFSPELTVPNFISEIKNYLIQDGEFSTTNQKFFREKNNSETLATWLTSCGLDTQVQVQQGGTEGEWYRVITRAKVE